MSFALQNVKRKDIIYLAGRKARSQGNGITYGVGEPLLRLDTKRIAGLVNTGPAIPLKFAKVSIWETWTILSLLKAIIERVMEKIPELYEIAAKLFEEDAKSLVEEMYQAL